MKAAYTNRKKAIKEGKPAVINYDKLVYGTSDKALIVSRLNEPLSDALCRYMDFKDIGTNDLAVQTGISASSISRYRRGKRGIKRDYLCAICIALCLLPCHQRHLFAIAHLEMPDNKSLLDNREIIIRDFMDGCSYDDRFTLDLCNKTLKVNGERRLTALNSDTEGAENE